MSDYILSATLELKDKLTSKLSDSKKALEGVKASASGVSGALDTVQASMDKTGQSAAKATSGAEKLKSSLQGVKGNYSATLSVKDMASPAIRKVNGAESFAILEMLVQDVLWISFPAVVAGTLGAWYVGGLWMEQFAVTVGSLVPYYVCVAIVVLILIVSCVISKTWRIANENPVKSIKSE